MMTGRMQAAAVAAAVLGLTATASGQERETPPPRAGLSALQTREAVRIAGPSLKDQREKAEGADAPDVDPREYVVGVERIYPKDAKGADPKAEAPARAVVTSYRYFDDTTVYAVVDLATGKPVEVTTSRHTQTPLSDGEYEAAKTMAREGTDEVKALYARFGKRLEVYPQFSQYTPDGETRVHRVVHLLYRVDRRDLSAPRPVVDLTTRKVVIMRPEGQPEPEPEAKPAPPAGRP